MRDVAEDTGDTAQRDTARMSRGRTRTQPRTPRPQRALDQYMKPLSSATSVVLTGEGPENAAGYRSWRVRCRAPSRQSGLQCRNWATRFSTVCKRHGSNLTREAAERRRAALANGVVATLEQLLEPYNEKRVRLSAAKLVMVQLGLPVAAPRKPADPPELEATSRPPLDDEIKDLLRKLGDVS